MRTALGTGLGTGLAAGRGLCGLSGKAIGWLVAALMLAHGAAAQESGPLQIAPPGFGALGSVIVEFPLARGQTSFVTLDQERIYTDSRFGQRVADELAEASRALARENRSIESALTTEERELTAQRADLPTEEFRALAEAFDARVVGLRRAQDGKALALQQRDDAERQVFSRAALPILQSLIAELGAVAILDTRAVLLADPRLDVTDRAIARIDARIGAGEELSPPGPILPQDPEPLPSSEPSADEDGVGLGVTAPTVLDAPPPSGGPDGIGPDGIGAPDTSE